MIIKIDTERKFLGLLIVLSLIVRLVPSLLYIDPPDIPHDFPAYIRTGELILNGKSPYMELIGGLPSQYGPLFALTIASWIALFGKSYALLKIIFIIFDILVVLLMYYITKSLLNADIAKFASVFFSLSYIPLVNVVHGSSNPMFMFFTLLSIFFIIKDKSNFVLSAISLAIGIGYKVVPVIILPAILYYLYQIKRYTYLIQYIFVSLSAFTLILLPFYLKAGSNVFFPYMPNDIINTVAGTNFLELYHYLDYFFIVGYNTPYENYVFPNQIANPFLLLGFSIIIIYVLKNPLNDKKIELIRNSFLLIFTGLMFGKIFSIFYLYWIFPLVLFLLFYVEKNYFLNFKLEPFEILGFPLVLSGILIEASLYRWAIDYSFLERLLILIGSIAASIGTYLIFKRSSFRIPLSLLTLAASFGSQLHAYVLMIFGTIIPILAIRKFAWGIFAFGINVIMVLAMILLFKTIHDKLKMPKKVPVK